MKDIIYKNKRILSFRSLEEKISVEMFSSVNKYGLNTFYVTSTENIQLCQDIQLEIKVYFLHMNFCIN